MYNKTIHAPRRRLTRRPPHAGGGRQHGTAICALLLSFAIAAGAASDAFAQSNTDRLVGLVETTDGNNAMLGAIQDMLAGLGGQIAAVQNAITALAENMSALSGDTAAVAGDVDGLAGKVDAANERIAGLDGKADAVETGVAGLTGKVDAVNMRVDGAGSKMDDVNMHINGLVGKVDAANACAADLHARADAVQSNFADLSARMGSAESGAAAIRAEVDGLKTAMAGHSNTGRLDPSYAERLDAIPSIRAALDALGEGPDETAALNEISDGITANSARIAALEDAINRIGSHIAGVAGKLDAVETAVERNVGPAPTSLNRATAKYDVTFGHFGDAARGKVPPVGYSTLTVTYTFSCKADVFIGRVSMGDNNQNLWPHSKIPPQGGHNWNRIAAVEGITIFDRYFFVGGDPNNDAHHKLFNVSFHDFGLMELGAGETLDFKSTWRGTHSNTTGGGSGVGTYIVAKYSSKNITVPDDYEKEDALLQHVPKPYTKAKLGAIKLYENAVEYYSAAKNAECSFQRTSGFSTELTKEGQKVLSVPAGGGQLVNKFETGLDCNGLPTMVTGVNTEVPGGLSLHQHSTFRLLSGEGDKERTLGVFKFNPNGTVTHASGDFPFTFEGAPLRVNGTLAGAPGLLVVVDYKTTEDNTCG